MRLNQTELDAIVASLASAVKKVGLRIRSRLMTPTTAKSIQKSLAALHARLDESVRNTYAFDLCHLEDSVGLDVITAISAFQPTSSAQLYTTLKRGEETNDIRDFTMLLKYGAQVNEIVEGETPLTRAIKRLPQVYKREAVKCLLDSGADPNMQNNKAESPVILALKTDAGFSLLACMERRLFMSLDHALEDNGEEFGLKGQRLLYRVVEGGGSGQVTREAEVAGGLAFVWSRDVEGALGITKAPGGRAVPIPKDHVLRALRDPKLAPELFKLIGFFREKGAIGQAREGFSKHSLIELSSDEESDGRGEKGKTAEKADSGEDRPAKSTKKEGEEKED
uniref:Uncharacterized protein n=1 Tax=Chromera velia CCMP2878 TaxID=1169474 RepID=A0A0G4HS56_9ALVE|eukprot:Cvel_1306.t1-p1 / transcript=Cvel_1306.t1 / gene=Cvel_1306 / organism=Chromera_velia_CCMP2878 / gene_product=hypothetical protein / transcript_product=hypothetical protein / location=Cvel_scaffold44:100946-102028(+) / protein_length=336 / sequence_SO=supercontig / SO=protein_coding / is_pseudo=false